jgi:hypothetical protein
MANGLAVGVNYVNKTNINISTIDYSEVIKVKSATIKTSINVLTGNGYNVMKYEIMTDVSKENYIITASGMYGQFCGTDDNENYIFKVLQTTTIINKGDNSGIIIPVNTKIVLQKSSSNKYMYKKNNQLVNSNENDGKGQNALNTIINNTYDSISNIGNPENVMSAPKQVGSASRKKSKSYSSYKSRKSLKCKTWKNKQK